MKNLALYLLLVLSFNSFSQEKKKDTLFIKYDSSLLNREQIIGEKDFLYRIKGTGNDGFVFLLEGKTYENLKPKKIRCLKKVLSESNAYNKKKLINDWKLATYLGKYVIFLVREYMYIKVQAVYEID